MNSVRLDIKTSNNPVSIPDCTMVGRNLLDIPQEIKDQIYGYVVADTYRVLPPLCNCDEQAPNSSKANIIDRSLLEFVASSLFRTSKRMRCEALQVLFSTSVLRCSVTCFDYHLWEFKVPTDRIMRVELEVNKRANSLACPAVHKAPSDRSPLHFLQAFGGGEISRKSICINFVDNMQPAFRVVKHTTLFHAMIKLTGFGTVKIEFGRQPSKVDTGSWLEGAKSYYTYDCKALKTAIKNALEPTLGPAMSGEFDSSSGYRMADHWFARCLEFRPRDFTATTLKIEEAGSGERGLEHRMRDEQVAVHD